MRVGVHVLRKLRAARPLVLPQVVAGHRVLRKDDVLLEVLLSEVLGVLVGLQTQLLEWCHNVLAISCPQNMLKRNLVGVLGNAPVRILSPDLDNTNTHC